MSSKASKAETKPKPLRKKERQKKSQTTIFEADQKMQKQIQGVVSKLEKQRGSRVVLFFHPASIIHDTVSDLHERLVKQIQSPVPKLDVIIDSGGGDIDAAFHATKILRQFVKSSGRLTFIVPRYAKSAATLMVCGGDAVCMGPTSELGPLDPQIIKQSPKGGVEFFSPLSISSMQELLESLIRDYLKNNAKEKLILARLLIEKLPSLELGQFLKTLDISKEYTERLLTTRMFARDRDKEAKAKQLAERLVRGYPHHGYCIDCDEARQIGLRVESCTESQWTAVWQIYKLYREAYRQWHENLKGGEHNGSQEDDEEE